MKCAQIIGKVTDGGTRKPDFTGFDKLARKLRKEYDWVFNPHDYEQEDKKWEEYMFESIDSLFTDRPECYLLPGWEQSIGARLEVEICKRLGLRMEEV